MSCECPSADPDDLLLRSRALSKAANVTLLVLVTSLASLGCNGGSAGTPGSDAGNDRPASGQGQGGAGGMAPQGGTGGAGGAGGMVPPADGGAPETAPPVDAGPGETGTPSGQLQIYWIDVEGGAATLLVSPNGQVVLVDAGWSGTRDANRIVQVVRDLVKATKIDVLIATHYHADHVGGVAPLAAMITVDKFYDHGPSVESGGVFNTYQTAAGNKRVTVRPGDKLQLGDLDLTFVTAAGDVIDPPLPTSAPNPLCPSPVNMTDVAGAENPMSVGFVARFGKFDLVDLGDLTWAAELKLMCPTNRIGTTDIYQVNHHGQSISGPPQLVHALAPTVAVMNNGASKGGASATFDIINASPGLQDLWSLHRVTANDAQHNAAEALTANLTANPDAGHWIKAVVQADGAYTLTNGRDGTTRTYAAR